MEQGQTQLFKDEAKGDVKEYLTIYKHFNFKPIEQLIPNKVRSITFVLPGMLKHSGGRTSVLQIGTCLSKLGYDVYYLSYKPQNQEEIEENCKFNLEDFQGTVLDSSALNTHQSDVWIATYWESAYVIKNLKGYKMYFVQDYEPYFFDYGDQYVLAQKTYELGLHMVSLGSWNKMMIEKNCKPTSPVDAIDFPYDTKNYTSMNRDFKSYRDKKEFNLAVYVKPMARRAPVITQMMLTQLEEKFKEDGITLNVNYFGSTKDEFLMNGTNLGKLTKQELNELYHRSDFGMVASMTNISLVPYEMITTQLPVIEFKDGTFPFFFGKNSAILTNMDYEDLYQQIKYYMNHPAQLKMMVQTAQSHLQNLSWDQTSNQFADIIKSVESNGKKSTDRKGSYKPVVNS